ncbi:hypothetical protein QEH59_09905 [Coraliomargarita sp. SDUM461004]|uniref:VWA domain-containing protein n=1 Tax=Thalassobacterium sedimentorum TaxID=3041258 RepID=A0ABU1AIT9_9BACT|nr:BatA domain-containing protein [Coraliomargarita sp. SDUM461004]MDQ8194739.1 hypothetical protein [Coraliomargarita sp. SDUM461004]
MKATPRYQSHASAENDIQSKVIILLTDGENNSGAHCAMSSFIFQSPHYLWYLTLVFPLAWLLSRARKQRVKVIAAMGGSLPTHRQLRDYLRLSAFCLIVLALARPGHSPRSDITTHNGRDVVLALDVSRSMLRRRQHTITFRSRQTRHSQCFRHI